jgi:hypothetical protein
MSENVACIRSKNGWKPQVKECVQKTANQLLRNAEDLIADRSDLLQLFLHPERSLSSAREAPESRSRASDPYATMPRLADLFRYGRRWKNFDARRLSSNGRLTDTVAN